MNLTLHLVRTDLVRMRAWIACWVGVLLLPILMGASWLARSPLVDERWKPENTSAILAGLQVVVGYILTILLIHEHGIVGTRQFWLTRPISPGRLLGAKSITVLVMVGLLPVVVSLPWWLWCGFGFGQIFNAAAETLLVMMLVAVPAALMAVLTDSLSRALLWTVVLVALLLFAMLFLTIVNVATVQSARDFSLVISRSVVAVVAVATVMLAVVVVQFLVRRRGWWLGVAGALAVLLVLASFRWPWGWLPVDPREFNTALADPVTLRFEEATAGPPPRASDRKPGQEVFQQVDTRLIAGDVPKEFGLNGLGIRQRWYSDGGINIARREHVWAGIWPDLALGLRGPEADPETQRWTAEKSNPERRPQLAHREFRVRVTSWIQPSIVARMQAEPPKYEARMWWQLFRAETRFQLPIAASGWMTRDGRGIRISQVEREPGSLKLVLVETRPVLIRGLLNEEAMQRAWFNRVEPRETWLGQIHRGRGEFLNSMRNVDDPKRVIVNGVEIAWRMTVPNSDQVVRNGKWQERPPKTDGDTLMVVVRNEEAVFSRRIEVERLELPAAK